MTYNDRALEVIRDQGRGLEFLLMLGFISYILYYLAQLYLMQPTQFLRRLCQYFVDACLVSEKLTNFQPTPTEDTEYLTLKAEENTPNSIEFFIFLNLKVMNIEIIAYILTNFTHNCLYPYLAWSLMMRSLR